MSARVVDYKIKLLIYWRAKETPLLEFCQVIHVVHKRELHELSMTGTLSKVSGLLEFMAFCLSGMWATIHEYLNGCH